MGTTLTGTRISDTYDSLLKATDNGIITSSAKQITDGVGNNTPLYISTSRIGIGVSPTTTFQVSGNSKIGGDLTVTGNLLVEGTTTTVDTDTLSVKDPLIIVGNDNNTSDLVDLGFYGLYDTSGSQDLYAGLYRSASDTKFHLFKDLQEEPTTTVNTSGTGYTKADLVIGALEAITGDFSGNVDIDGTLNVDDVISIEGSAFGRIEIGGASGGYIDLKAPNSDDYDFRIITSSGGNEITTATGDLIFNTAETLALTLDTSQNATFAGDINLPLNKKIQLGNNQELEIYRDANDSRIVDEDSIIIKSQHIAFQAGTSTETIAHFYGDSSVELYYDGVKKFNTTSTGINVTGDVDFTGNINIGDNQKILFGDSGDVEMFFNGSTFIIDDTVEVFGFDIDTNLIRFRGTDLYTEISNGQHTFWTNGTERFKINATEVKVSHQLNVTGDLTVGN